MTELKPCPFSCWSTCVWLEDEIKRVPSVDAVEVVRCKDCKYNDDGVCDRLMYYHQKWGLSTQYVDDNDYCKWGEKE